MRGPETENVTNRGVPTRRNRAVRSEAGRSRARIPDGPWDVAVVGAGPAGLLAAIAAADGGARVIVIERMERPGLKILASGGGRCNLTNSLDTDDFLRGLGRNGRFARDALLRFGPDALRRLLSDNGVPTVRDREGLVFPRSDRSEDVLAALLGACRERNMPVITRTEASAPRIRGDRIQGVETPAGAVRARCVVLAAGGRGYPRLGGSEAGHRFAAEAGHTIVPAVPANVPLVTGETWPRTLAGVSLARVELRIAAGAHSETASMGPLLFTHRGISGPAALDASGAVAEALVGASGVPVTIDLCPGRAATHVVEAIDARRRTRGGQPVSRLLRELVPVSFGSVLLNLTGVSGDTSISRLSRRDTGALQSILRACPLTIIATEGFDRAMVTRGGVSLKEIDPRTMESRRVAGLFLAGEVVDIDGPCGGFNMQWAFSSGRLAGESAVAASRGPAPHDDVDDAV